MKIALVGACGRMGVQVVRLVAAGADVQLAAALERPGHTRIGEDAGRAAGVDALGVVVGSSPEPALAACDVVLDFSVPEGSAALAEALEATPRPAVVAVTGMGPGLRARWTALAGRVPVLLASNLSLGAAVLRQLGARAARALPGFDVEIVETHHRGKADAPSGTALDIVAGISRARGLDPAACPAYGRRPGDGKRLDGAIGVHAVRGGTVTGEHEILLLGDHERLSLRHTAEARVVFARGALEASRWIAGRAPGLYSMDDVAADALDP